MTTSNPIIRIVDDEAVVRKALKFLLESEGWTVEAYEKGSEFLIEDRLLSSAVSFLMSLCRR